MKFATDHGFYPSVNGTHKDEAMQQNHLRATSENHDLLEVQNHPVPR